MMLVLDSPKWHPHSMGTVLNEHLADEGPTLFVNVEPSHRETNLLGHPQNADEKPPDQQSNVSAYPTQMADVVHPHPESDVAGTSLDLEHGNQQASVVIENPRYIYADLHHVELIRSVDLDHSQEQPNVLTQQPVSPDVEESHKEFRGNVQHPQSAGEETHQWQPNDDTRLTDIESSHQYSHVRIQYTQPLDAETPEEKSNIRPPIPALMQPHQQASSHNPQHPRVVDVALHKHQADVHTQYQRMFKKDQHHEFNIQHPRAVDIRSHQQEKVHIQYPLIVEEGPLYEQEMDLIQHPTIVPEGQVHGQPQILDIGRSYQQAYVRIQHPRADEGLHRPASIQAASRQVPEVQPYRSDVQIERPTIIQENPHHRMTEIRSEHRQQLNFEPPHQQADVQATHPQVIRPTPIRMLPLYVDDLPCSGYPGPIKIPLCGRISCRHIPCYTWHLSNPPLQLPVYRRCPPSPTTLAARRAPPRTLERLKSAEAGGILKELLLDPSNNHSQKMSTDAATAPPVTPLHATVTTPNGTVTLYRWSDEDVEPEVIQLHAGPDDFQYKADGAPGEEHISIADENVQILDNGPKAKAPRAPRARRKPAEPRKPRQPRKPVVRRLRKSDQKPILDQETRTAAMLRSVCALGMLRDSDRIEGQSFPFIRPRVSRRVRKAMRGVGVVRVLQ